MLFALMFADQLDAAGQTLAVGGWVGGCLSVVGTVVNAIISARVNRDRLQYDADKQRMGYRIESLEADVLESRQAEAVCRKDLSEVRAELKEAQAELKSVTDYLLRKGVPGEAIAPKPQ